MEKPAERSEKIFPVPKEKMERKMFELGVGLTWCAFFGHHEKASIRFVIHVVTKLHFDGHCLEIYGLWEE